MFERNSLDGYSHNLYIGAIGQLTFRYNYSARTNPGDGHLLKSRAAKNYVLYNRLSGEGSPSSYEINLPNGGESFVIGNVIQQSQSSANGVMLDYGSEGLKAGSPAVLAVASNSFHSTRGNATFVRLVAGTTCATRNNLFVGNGAAIAGGACDQAGDLALPTDPGFVDAAQYDYHLAAGSTAIGTGAPAGMAGGRSLHPVNEYLHPANAAARKPGAALDVGAFQR